MIITRIAPSPTGMFHIGTARTALFNFLFAKKNKGKFILRIEDTDPVRSKKEYEKDIIDGLKWLGLKWDSIKAQNSKFEIRNKSEILNSNIQNRDYCKQSERLKLYQRYIKKLIDKDAAYKKEGAVWFRLSSYPKKFIEYEDLILGKLKFDKVNFNDFVLIKSDGVPLYMFAAVVDDHLMGMTHIIRGDDHINSTPQQIMLYESLGFKIPNFAHIPMILNSDRTKMSKRKNPVSVTRDFQDKGYLPQAMINYMALLGWNPKTDQEFFNLNQLVKKFDLSKVNKSGAIFDIKKLNYFNNQYIKKSSNDFLITLILKLKTHNHNLYLKTDKNQMARIIEVIKEKMNNLIEIDKLSDFFFTLSSYESKLLIFKKSNREKTLRGLTSTYNTFKASVDSVFGDKDILNQILVEIVKANKLENGDVFWPVRAALSGLEKSPSPTELLWVLGKAESLKRIGLAIKKLTNN